MKYAYAALLRLYPGSYRTRFEDEMAAVFEAIRRDRLPCGSFRYAWFLIVEFVGLCRAAAAEWGVECERRWKLAGRLSTTISLLIGAILTAAIHGRFYTGVHLHVRAAPAHVYSQTEAVELLVLGGASLFLVAAFSVVSVLNARTLADRNQKGRTTHARTSRRDEAVCRNSRRQGR
jgi:hypothetical protein